MLCLTCWDRCKGSRITARIQKSRMENGLHMVPVPGGDAACIIPWTLYKFYGDEILLAEQYPVMRDWVDYILRVDEEQCGGKRLWSTGFHFADWLALDNPDKTSSFGGTDNTYVATAFYYYSALLTAKAAYVLGIRQDARDYRQLAREIKNAFRREYFSDRGELTVRTQTAMVLALYFGLAPKNSRKKIGRRVKKEHPGPWHAPYYRFCGHLLSVPCTFRVWNGPGGIQPASSGRVSWMAL